MSDEQPIESGRRRTRGIAATARSEALERLKAIRSGGRRDLDSGGFQMKMDEPIYDMVSDDEYEALKAKRGEAAKGFIVDDDGLGYGDEGQEEDWSLAGASFSSEESEGESERPVRKKSNSEKKAKVSVKKPSALASAAASMGKQSISKMFTSSVFKKDTVKNLSCDSIVDDVIAEFAPDENDREMMRRRGRLGKMNVNNFNSRVLPVKVESRVFVNTPRLGGRNEVSTSNGGHGDVNVGSYKDNSEKCENVLGGEIHSPNKATNSAYISTNNEIKVESEPIVENGHVNSEVLMVEAEVKNEVAVEKKASSLNAKLEKANDQTLSATLGWQAVRNAGQSVVADSNEQGSVMNLKIPITEGSVEFEVESNGSMPFYLLDAYEEMAYGPNRGNLYLFGKVKTGGKYQSCCAIVKNMQRCVYAIPAVPFMENNTITELEKNVDEYRISVISFKEKLAKQLRDGAESQSSEADLKDKLEKLEKRVEETQTALRTRLHELASDLKTEMAEKLLTKNVSSFSMTPVKRNYAFERSDIPHGENYSIKINYPFKDDPLPVELQRGKSFRALLGTHTSALELFLVKRKIKGPSWLSISKFSNSSSERVSWCKFEVIVDCPKDIHVSVASKYTSEIPPVMVTAIKLKTVSNEKNTTSEIVSAHIICCHKAKVDTPILSSEWTRPGMLTHFTVVRKLKEGIFPMGFLKEVDERNKKAGKIVICHESSERALLNRLMVELHKLDSDILVGHNISGFDMDVFLHRVQACGVPWPMWSKIGRLKRRTMPKFSKGSSVFGSGASPQIMSCIAGRLLCDTFLCSRDLLKEVSYSLTQLAKSQLNKDHKDIAPHDIPTMFQSSKSLLEFIECGETDAWLSLELMFHLSVLPLTRQLTNISGNLWNRTLQGARAQRVEYLLLHAFHAKKFIVPDKFFPQSKEKITVKRKINNDDSKEIDLDDTNHDNEPQEIDNRKPRKGPAYSGGLVLEPKKGLYDKYILLLDFNSLYPSIIQEYNICFTTVDRYSEGPVPPTNTTGVLPELLKNLVERRKMVKGWLKSASGLKAQQFDIQQQALKLTANSMYGCLGFSNSRFYAKPLAELITLQGRDILKSTVDLVQNTLNLEVIYGDTDSIMIYSGHDDIKKAKLIAGKVIKEVNKKYKTLEIDLDGLYKRMLLLKKKKYAAVKVQFKDGVPYEVIERKGLDMVRRDWSLLSKESGDFCLDKLLSGGSCDDVVEVIHSFLVELQDQMRKGKIPLEKYVINKTLTKPPEQYPDAKSQPHVEVALRRKRSGYVTGCSAGDTVPYIICCEEGNGSTTSIGIAQRARHPDELKKDNGNWIVDIDYYLAQQLHPVISRLCASIEGTSPARLADCLGLDSSKFQNKSNNGADNDPASSISLTLDDEERFRGCEPLSLSCPSCSNTFECSPIFSTVCAWINENQTDAVAGPSTSFWQKFCCTKCPEEGDHVITAAFIANQVKGQAEKFMSTYYKGLMMCDDETCNYTGRSVNPRVIGDAERGTVCPNYPSCNGHIFRKYTEAELYKQLTYFCHVLDSVHCIDKVDIGKRPLVEKELVRIRPRVTLAASIVQKLRDRCAYGWVKLDSCF